jgi:hypothetical protein
MVYCTERTMLLGFVHSLMFLKNTTFRELDLFPSSGTIMEAPTLLGHVQHQTVSGRLLARSKQKRTVKVYPSEYTGIATCSLWHITYVVVALMPYLRDRSFLYCCAFRMLLTM